MVGSVRFIESECKSALTRVQGMPFQWSLNPYRGCMHSCPYCYARSYFTRMDRDPGAGFDREIEVKMNFATVLERELRRPHDGAVALGTATDPYQPCEGSYRITRGTLEALVRRPMPLSIITKGTMIVRDLDLLIAIAKRAELRVWSSITTVDAALARQLEPKAPSPAKRLEAIRRMRAAGLRSGVLLAPVIPGITDSEPAMRAVAEAAHSAGAVAFGSRPLKLDPGTKDVFYAFVAAQFPELLPRYLDRYGDGTKLDATYLRSLEARIERASAGLRFHDEPQRFSEPAQLQLAL
ncbi:MAG TPA: radical SAM protein [Candidatus Limnocylindria bacterium]|jgi:DNA repair photolyase